MSAVLSSPKRLVFFFDKGRFGLKSTLGRYWARKGLRPIEQVKPAYQNFYVYSSVSPHTGKSFSLFLPWVNTEVMNVYLENLSAAYPGYRILLFGIRPAGTTRKNCGCPQTSK